MFLVYVQRFTSFTKKLSLMVLKSNLRIQSDGSEKCPLVTPMPCGLPQPCFSVFYFPQECGWANRRLRSPRLCVAWPLPTFPVLSCITPPHLHCSLLWSECWCAPKFICWHPHDQCDDIRRWGLWGCLGLQVGAPMKGISVLIKESPRFSLVLPTCEDTTRTLWPRRWSSPDHADMLISDF